MLLLPLPPLVLGLVLGAAQDSPPGTPDGDVRALFLANCATCHGEAGDGKGVTELPRPARSFLDGGFSYGNTRDALLRTVTHGIPGTPMPGFGAALDEAQRAALVEYVISLGPERVEVQPNETVLAVGDRAQVVRGFVPAAVEGAPEFPRGLLVGLPTGTTFQYRADDVRLVAVRQGEFVERRDWGDRGGNPLKPLGAVTFLCDEGRPAPTFTLDGDALTAKLGSTRVDGEHARIAYRLVDADGRLRAQVVEEPTTRTTTLGAGFERRFVIFFEADAEGTLRLDVLNPVGEPEEFGFDSALDGLTLDAWRAGDGSVLVAAVESSSGARVAGDGVEVVAAPGARASLSVTVLATADWNADVAVTLLEELAR